MFAQPGASGGEGSPGRNTQIGGGEPESCAEDDRPEGIPLQNAALRRRRRVYPGIAFVVSSARDSNEVQNTRSSRHSNHFPTKAL
jgi:hypothetical protein